MVAKAPVQFAIEIKRRRQVLGLSQRELARESKLGENAVKDLESGKVKRGPRDDTRQAIQETLAKLERQRGIHAPGASVTVPAARDSRGYGTEAISEVDVRASAGGGAIPVSEDIVVQWQFPSEFVRGEIRSNATDLRIITIDGDSMAPTLDPGDKVVVDVSRTTPSPPGVFVVWDGLALVAKRLEFIEGSEPHRVRIVSDNPRYQVYERTADEIRVIGRVRGRWERL